MTPLAELLPTRSGLGRCLVAAIILWAAPSASHAQPLSSGSGAGTGTGMSGGASRNTTGTGMSAGAGNFSGTGNESGTGLSLPGSNNNINPSRNGRLISPNRLPQGSVSAGSGVDATFPGESGFMALDPMFSPDGGQKGGVSYVTELHLKYAQAIPSPGDRSLALSRVASAATFSNQLDVADFALRKAADSAFQMPAGLVRDQRLQSIIAALMNLAEAHLREGRSDAMLPAFADLSDLNPNAPPTPADDKAPKDDKPKDDKAAPAPDDKDKADVPDALPKIDRNKLIVAAIGNWNQAGSLAQRIGNPTYRNEMIFRVADSMGFGSQSIVNEYPKSGDADAKDKSGIVTEYGGLPDQLLEDAAQLCERIERPVWHDRALVSVSGSAAESKQFARALDIARRIPQPEVRSNALLKVAEIQARRGDPNGATATYRETAESVASIPLEDVRAVLAGVLVDNLISVGRFDDARASVTLYPDEARRIVALGSIAESQGKRGAAASAIAWIRSEVPESYRSHLYRKVNNGVVASIEDNRSKDLSSRAEGR